jgi:serine/threonine protein kinase
MGTVYKINQVQHFAPFERTGTVAYWPPEMQEGKTHHMHYDIYCVGLLLLEARTAQLPFMHLLHLPWEQQRLRRTYPELVASGCCRQLLPRELQLLEKCLEVDVMARPLVPQLLQDQYLSEPTPCILQGGSKCGAA